MEQVHFPRVEHASAAADTSADAQVQQTDRKRSLFKLLAKAEEKERRRIARELHDTTAQDLLAVDLNLRRIEKACHLDPGHGEASALFEETSRLLKQAQRDLRTMSYVLHPPPVQESGLAVALRTMVQGLTGRARFDTSFETNLQGRFPVEIEETLYRVTQEALINVCRHAAARQVAIRCHQVGDRIDLEIEDDGVGFDMDGDAPRLGVGLRAIRARVHGVSGRFDVVPLAGGSLIRISVRLPSAQPG